ncbi:hypothetical protein V8F20_008628 [Naviculisporaceae sp. PSN 640]
MACFDTSAARSVEVALVNKTGHTLYWSDSGVSHGERKVTAPDTIKNDHTDRWMLESNGFMTGVEGWMNWNVGENASEGAVVKLEYNNPFSGSNKYNGYVTGDNADRYEVTKNGGSGDNAQITFTVWKR